MTKTLRATALSIAIVGGLVAAMPAAIPHFALSSSSPEADATVQSPTEIRLSFTEEPAEGTVQIRVVEADDAGIHVEDVMQDAEDGRVFSIEMHGTFEPGTYTVSWRGMGGDGHVVRDTFQFTVVAQ